MPWLLQSQRLLNRQHRCLNASPLAGSRRCGHAPRNKWNLGTRHLLGEHRFAVSRRRLGKVDDHKFEQVKGNFY